MNEPVICGFPLVITAFVVGAEMMRPSSTIANWFRTPVRAFSRAVTLPNSSEPLALKTMLTAQTPVLTPWLLEFWPLVASEIVSPATSTGPRMYLYCWRPFWATSQVMSGLPAGATFVFAASTLSQLKSVNCFCRAGVTYATSLPLVGLVLGVDWSGASETLGFGVGVGLPTALVAAASDTRTARNSSLADDSMRSIVA